jgi:hypothetical protein
VAAFSIQEKFVAQHATIPLITEYSGARTAIAISRTMRGKMCTAISVTEKVCAPLCLQAKSYIERRLLRGKAKLHKIPYCHRI